MAAIQTCFRRIEMKYLLTRQQYSAVKRAMAVHVKPDAYSRYTICSIYYDTEDYRLIRTSLEKPVYKEKLRLRSYGVPYRHDPVFVELKKKFDGVVYKRRITLEAEQAEEYLKGRPLCRPSQISREIDWFMQSYRAVPKAFIGYDREAYAGRELPDLRITFDTNLRARNRDLCLRSGDWGELILPQEQILMELKIPDSAPLWLARLLSDNGIYPSSFSKYGTYYRRLAGKQPSWGFFEKGAYLYA